MSTPQRSKLLHSVRQWKDKATSRRRQVEALKKRVIELAESRDAWKEKAQASQMLIVGLQRENRRLTHPDNTGEKKQSRTL